MRIVNSLLLFLLLLPSVSLAFEEVTLSTKGKSDHLVRMQAKNQALINALDKLPSVVWGEEAIKDDVFAENIYSIGFAHAIVTIDTESFNRAQETYTLKANVDFDKQAILNTLSLVSQGQFALKTLDKIKAIMSTSDLSKFLDRSASELIPLNVEAKLYTNPYFYAQTYSKLVSFHEALIDDFSSLLSTQIKSQLSNYTVNMVKVTKDKFTYHLSGPRLAYDLTFVSSELQSIYDDYKDEIRQRSGGICLFSPLVNRFYHTQAESDDLDMTLDVNNDFALVAYPEFLYQGEMLAFEFVYCDGKTKQLALDLNTAKKRFIQETAGYK